MACNFIKSSSLVLYNQKVAMLGPMFTHMTKLLCVSFKCFLNMLAFSSSNCMKRSSWYLFVWSICHYGCLGVDFLHKYLLYFFKLMTPLSFKSVAAQLNISNDKGPVLTLVVVIDDGSNWNGWYGIDAVLEGFVVSI